MKQVDVLSTKQQRAVQVVQAALLRVGCPNRSVCVTVDQWCFKVDQTEHLRQSCAVFVSAPQGQDCEPAYETGLTLVEAVRKVLNGLHGKTNGTALDNSAAAPF